jgi:hypothetical protein
MCNWRIQRDKEIITGSYDERSVVEGALKELALGAVEKVVLLHPAIDLSIRFDSGVEVLTFSSSSDLDEDQ